MNDNLEKKILIVDDDLAIRFTLKKLLVRYLPGAKIFTSEDGVEGLGYAMILKPDFLIIDITLPRYSGRELIDFLISNNKFKEIPIVLLREEIEGELMGLPPNYIQISKNNPNFPKDLVRNLVDRSTRNTYISSDVIIQESNIKWHSKIFRILNFLARKIIRYSNRAYLDLENTGKKSLLRKTFNNFKFLVNQVFSGFYLTLFYILIGRSDTEENVDQKRKDILKYRSNIYPQIAVTLALFFFFTFQIASALAGIISVTFFSTIPVQAAAVTWNGLGTDGTCGGTGTGNNWSCGANWSSGTAPASADTITFNGTSTKNATIDAGFQGTISTLTIASGYTGTITQARSLTVSSTFTTSAGFYSAANQSLTINGAFSMNTGSDFTASSGTVTFGASITISGGTFHNNSGTVAFTHSAASSSVLACNNVTFNLVTIALPGNTTTINSDCSFPLGNNPATIGSNGNLIVNGTLSGTGTLAMSGNSTTTTLNSTAVISGFSGFTLGTQSLTIAGYAADFSTYTTFTTGAQTTTVSSGSLKLPNNSSINNLTISGGTFTAPSGTLTIAGNFSITGSPTFTASGGTIDFSGGAASIDCLGKTFSSVNFTGQTGVKTIGVTSACNLPLGASPTIPNGISLSANGILTGTGTLTETTGAFAINNGGSLSGFSGLSIGGAFSMSATTVNNSLNLGSYSSVTFSSSFTLNNPTNPFTNTFTAPTGTMVIIGGVSILGTASFVHNNGTVEMQGTANINWDCNGAVFNKVNINRGATNTVIVGATSDCNLPMGANPTINGNVSLSPHGIISGTGTLSSNGLSNTTLTFNGGGSLSGFSGLVASNLTTTATAADNITDLSSYKTLTVSGVFTMSTPTAPFANTFIAPDDTMTVGGNFTVNTGATFTYNSGNLMTDGNMEMYLVRRWTAGNSATLTKQTTNPHGGTQDLRVARNGVNLPYAYQAIATAGNTYRVKGYFRGDGTAFPTITNGVNIIATGTSSTSWQPFDVINVPGTSFGFVLVTNASVDGQYSEFDDVSVTSQLITDGNMEAAGTTNWTAGNSAGLSKQTTTPHGGLQTLRVTYGGVSNPNALQTTLVTGNTYRVTAYGRSDGTALPRLVENGNLIEAGTNSTNWQLLDAVFVATGNTFRLQAGTSTASTYAEFDDVTVTQITQFTDSTHQLYADNDMEASDVTSWTAASSTLTKQTSNPHSGSQLLRITNTSTNGSTYQVKNVIGSSYHVTGYIRSDGNAIPKVSTDNGTTFQFVGTNSTSWQYFDFTYTATTTNVRFYAITAVNGQYIELDDISVIQVGATQLLNDNDMETSGIASWTVNNSATVTKETASPHGGTYSIRVKRNGATNPSVSQIVLIPGRSYKITGWAHGDGGNGVPRIYAGGTSIAWQGSNSTSWQQINVIAVPDSTGLYLYATVVADGDYAQFDDMSVTLITPTLTLDTGNATITCNNTTFNLVTFNHPTGTVKTISTGCNLPLGADPYIPNALTINGTLSGTGTMFYTGTNTTTFASTGVFSGFHGIDYSANQGGFTNNGTLDLSTYAVAHFAVLTLTTGAFTPPYDTMRVSNNFTYTAGTFTANSGTQTDILTDGNMEASGVTYWPGSSGGTSSKQTGTPHGGAQVLRITANAATGSFSPQVYQNVLTIGKRYRIRGFARSDGAQLPRVINGVNALFVGTNSTSWQSFDTTFVATAAQAPLYFGITNPVGTEYVEFDDVSIVDAPIVAFDGTSSASIVCNSVAFEFVDFIHTAGVKTVDSTCSLPIGANPSVGSGGDTTLNGTFTGSGTLTTTGTFTLTGSATLTTFTGYAGNNISVGKTISFGTYTSFTTSGNLTLTANTLTMPTAGADINGSFTMGTGTFVAPSGTLKVAGNFTINSGIFTPNSGTIEFDGSDAAIACNAATFNSVKFTHTSGTKTVAIGCSNMPLGANPTVGAGGSVTLSGTFNGSGTLTTTGNFTLTGSATLTTFTAYSGNELTVSKTISFSAYSPFTTTGDLNLTANTLTMPTAGATIGGSLIISGGTFVAPSGTMNVAGSIQTATSATFTHSSGTVSVNGTETSLAQTTPTTSGLTAAYDLDENGGTTTADSSGNANTATLENGAAWSTGKIGNGVNFDGVNDDVSIPDTSNNDFDYNQDFTVSLWVKIPTTQVNTVNSANAIVEKWSNVGGYPYVLRVYNQTSGTPGRLIFARYDGTHNPAFASTVAINDNNFHLITMLKSGGTLSLYIDGVFNASTPDTTTTTTTNTSPVYLGKRGGGSTPFSGTVDELRIYNRALTTQEISDLFNPISYERIGYWKMDEASWTNNCSTNTVLDSSGNSNNGVSCPNATGPTGGAVGLYHNSGLFTASASQYVKVPNSASILSMATQGSVSGWVKLTTNDGTLRTLVDIAGTGPNGLIIMAQHTSCSGNKMGIQYGSTAGIAVACSTTLPVVGIWYYVTATWDGSGAKFYVNGTLEGSNSNAPAITIATANTFIGSNAGTIRFLDANLEDLNFYNRPINPAEIATLYYSQKSIISGCTLESTCTQAFNNLTLNQTNATDNVYLSTYPLRIASTLTLTNGILNQGTLNIRAEGASAVSVATNGTWSNTSTGDIILGGSVANNGTMILQGTSTACGDADAISITSTVGAAQRAWSGTGTFNFNDLTVQDQGGTSDIAAKSSTSTSGNGTNWHFIGCADNIPNDPTSTSQANGSNATIPDATWITANTVKFSANVSDPNNPDFLYLCVEMQPVGTDFTNVETGCSAGGTYSGTPISLTYTASGIADNAYHWQARTKDINGNYSDWVVFGKLDSGLVAYWKMDEGSWNGSVGEITDSSGNGNYATSGGAAGGTGTSTGSNTTTTLNDTGQAWTTSIFFNRSVSIISGTGSGQVRNITANTATQLTVSPAWGTTPDATSHYTIAGNQGTSTGSNTSTTFKDTNQNWLTNSFANETIRITGGTGNGQARIITSNTSTQITISGTWSITPDATSTYTILPSTVAGKFGNAGSFDGVAGFTRSTSSTLINMSAGTVSFWFNPSSSQPNSAPFIFSHPASAGGGGRVYILTNATGTTITNSMGAGTLVGATASITANDWHMVTVVWSGTTGWFYVDGVISGTATTFAGINSQTTVYEGTQGGSGYFDGLVDDTRIYNRALSASEVSDLYNSIPPTIAYWKFDECSGTSVTDYSGSGATGTINIGSGSTQTAVGNCNTPGTAWGNGKLGKFGSSMQVDGYDDYMSATIASIANHDFTVSVWANRTVSDATYDYLVNIGTPFPGTDQSLHITYMPGNQIRCGFFGDDLTSGGVYNDLNVWVNLTCTYNSTTRSRKLYRNGVLIGSDTAAANFSGGGVALIPTDNTNLSAVTGKIDEVKVFNLELSANQVAAIYNEGSYMDYGAEVNGPSGGVVYDGTTVGSDITFNNGSLSSLSANWSGFDFTPSALSSYDYSIGTTPGGTDIKGWTTNGTSTSVTASGLTLNSSALYYFNVRANDTAGNNSIVSSNGQYVAPSLSYSLSSNSITFNNLNPSNTYSDTETSTITTSTNAYNGYVIRLYKTGLLTSIPQPSVTIPDFSAGTYAAPAAWPAGTYGFGYTSNDTTIQGVNKFSPATCATGGGAPPCYAPFSSAAPGDIVADHTALVTGTPITSEPFILTYKVQTTNTQAAGAYRTTLIYSIIPQY